MPDLLDRVFDGAPPNMALYLTNGFNAKRFDFAGLPIFGPLAYTEAKRVNYGLLDTDYAVPDGFQADSVANFFTVTRKKAVQSESDFEQSFSIGVSAEGKVRRATARVSASVSSSLMLAGKLHHAVNQEYFLSFAIQTVCRVEREMKGGAPKIAPAKAFTDEAKALSQAPKTDAEWQAYSAFFDRYGTDFLLRGQMGGYFLTETRMDKLTVQNKSAAKIAAAVQAGIDVTIASGSFKADSAYAKDKFLSDIAETMSTRYECRGGLFSTEVRPWVISVFRNPILLPGIEGMCEPEMISIAELFPETHKAAARKALRMYLGDGRVLGARVRMPFDAANRPAISGLLLATLQTEPEPRVDTSARLSVTMLDPRPANFPREFHTAVHEQSGRGDYIPAATLTLPLVGGKGGAIADFERRTGAAQLFSEAQFVPIENPWAEGQCLNADAKLIKKRTDKNAAEEEYKPDYDGLLIGTAYYGGSEGAQGSLVLYEPQGSDKRVLGGCGVHNHVDKNNDQRLDYATFIAPVKAKQAYRIGYVPKANSPEFAVYYMGFHGGIHVGSSQPLIPNVAYDAEEDGLLLACIWLPEYNSSSDNRGRVILLTGDGRADLVPAETSPAASVAAQSWVYYNSVLIPVRRGERYLARFLRDTPNAKVECSVTFVPLQASAS